MARRTYDQICPLACALDLLGERWTLLVVRELIAGPKRYTDLQEGLPGIGTDLLTARLRELETAGAVRRRRLPAPAASSVYELTERGMALGPVLIALGRFGLPLMPTPEAGDEIPLERVGLILRILFEPEATRGRRDRFRLDVEGVGTVVAETEDGALRMHPDAEDADVTISAAPGTMIEIARGTLAPLEALASGRVKADDTAGVARFLTVFPPQPAAMLPA
jgi:DNA-binding HxlR family transcriptional regulator